MTPALAARSTDVGGARIHWVEAGSGDPPFLLVHGWGWGAVRWTSLTPLLAEHRRTIALDLPGFGRSDVPAGPYSPGWLAGAVRAFCDEIGVGRALVVGNSLGGLVSIYLAAAWPERVEALAAISPALPNDGPQPALRDAARLAAPALPVIGEYLYRRHALKPAARSVADSLELNCADPARVAPAVVALLEEEADRRATRPAAWRAAVAANRRMMWALTGRRERTWRIVRSLRVPVLFVWGDRDRLLPVHIGYRAVREVPGAHLVVLDGCGHNPQLECPEDLAGALVAFARATAARATG